MRAVELIHELEYQVYAKQQTEPVASVNWWWLEHVFDMLQDIKLYATPGLSGSERPEFRTIFEYSNQFRSIS